jgi:hypothetical protein
MAVKFGVLALLEVMPESLSRTDREAQANR